MLISKKALRLILSFALKRSVLYLGQRLLLLVLDYTRRNLPQTRPANQYHWIHCQSSPNHKRCPLHRTVFNYTGININPANIEAINGVWNIDSFNLSNIRHFFHKNSITLTPIKKKKSILQRFTKLRTSKQTTNPPHSHVWHT